MTQKRIEKGWMEASFTVEAALLFPILLLIVFTVIYVDFYLYDNVHLVSSVHNAAERAAWNREIWSSEQEDAEQQKHIRDLITELNSSISLEPSDVRLEKRPGRIKIQADMRRRGPAAVFGLSGLSEKAGFGAVKRKIDPAELTRIADVLWNAGKSVADQLREAR